MSSTFRDKAEVLIVGGGIAGVSVAYHLAKLGITDVVLCERKQLTCGTTWHAAGLVTQLRATRNMTELAKYTGELFASLEAETGQATGFSQRGALRIAKTEGTLRRVEARRVDGPEFRTARRCTHTRRNQGALVALEHRRHRWRSVASQGRSGQSDRRHDARWQRVRRNAGVTILENIRVDRILVEHGEPAEPSRPRAKFGRRKW